MNDGISVLAPGKVLSNPLDALSLGMALIFGAAGLPHIFLRFYTAPNAKVARHSLMYAMLSIGCFYLLAFVLGFGAIILVGQDRIGQIDAGGNMAVLILAQIWGDGALLGSIAAIFFAAILTVVTGLKISGAIALSHNLCMTVPHVRARESEQLKIVRVATLLLGILAIGLAIVFRGQNAAYLVSLALAIAASANFPTLLLSLLWRRFTTHGAVTSMVVGTVYH